MKSIYIRTSDLANDNEHAEALCLFKSVAEREYLTADQEKRWREYRYLGLSVVGAVIYTNTRTPFGASSGASSFIELGAIIKHDREDTPQKSKKFKNLPSLVSLKSKTLTASSLRYKMVTQSFFSPSDTPPRYLTYSGASRANFPAQLAPPQCGVFF